MKYYITSTFHDSLVLNTKSLQKPFDHPSTYSLAVKNVRTLNLSQHGPLPQNEADHVKLFKVSKGERIYQDYFGDFFLRFILRFFFAFGDYFEDYLFRK